MSSWPKKCKRKKLLPVACVLKWVKIVIYPELGLPVWKLDAIYNKIIFPVSQLTFYHTCGVELWITKIQPVLHKGRSHTNTRDITCIPHIVVLKRIKTTASKFAFVQSQNIFSQIFLTKYSDRHRIWFDCTKTTDTCTRNVWKRLRVHEKHIIYKFGHTKYCNTFNIIFDCPQ